jgi:general secretion pathway protein D
VLAGIPGLSDLPVVGRLFAHNRKETQETDILLTLTPHIIRVLDLTEADLRPFRVERDAGSPLLEAPERIGPLPKPDMPPRDQPEPADPAVPPLPEPIRPPTQSKPVPIPPPAKPIPER